MSGNDKSPSRHLSDSPQFTTWILDSVAMCNMKNQV